MAGQLIINAFDMVAASQIGHGLWRHPESERRRYADVDYWIEYAQLLERGRFDALFLADSYGADDPEGPNAKALIRHGVYFPSSDPSLYVAAMAAATEHLGFVVTQSTSFEAPVVAARRLASLDHLTRGRLGMNIVTSSNPAMARLHGHDGLRDHDVRYDVADEFLDVLAALWQRSWGAQARGRAGDDFLYDPEQVHAVRHAGVYFAIEGHFPAEPSPQRTPLLFQAGNSGRGLRFAAEHAEVVLIAARTPAQARSVIAETRQRVADAGRDPSSLRFLLACSVIVEDSDRAAARRIDGYRAAWSTEAALASNAVLSGYDLRRLPPDAVFRFEGAQREGTAAEPLRQAAAEGLTVRETIERVAGLGARNTILSGGPERVADLLEEWSAEGGVDGFNIWPLVPLVDIRNLVDHLVPELQRRGRLRQSYASRETLRERYFPGAGPHLRPDHRGAAAG